MVIHSFFSFFFLCMDSPAKHFPFLLLSSCINDNIYLIILQLSLVRLGCEQEILKGGKEYSDTEGESGKGKKGKNHYMGGSLGEGY